MEISVKRNCGISIVFRAENVHVEENIEQRLYSKTEDGKTDFSKPSKRDVNTEILDQFAMVMDDLIYYRVEKYDSSSLIERLFEKLQESEIQKLLSKLKRDYDEDAL